MNNIELYINNQLVDLGDDSLRLNNTIFDPTKLTATTSSYSYTYKLPLTPNNAKILGNVNAISKRNKFNNRYICQLYSEGIKIFDGSGKISQIKNDEVSFNLYNPKINQLNEIFGDDVMSNIKWEVPFDGIKSVNEVNLDSTSKYFFPIVAYGLFQKDPLGVIYGENSYSDKKTVDEWTNFHYNSFVPSLQLVELLRRAFRQYGYELDGDIITDPVLNEIYLSNYISSEQDPAYNLGNKVIGQCEFDLSFSNYTSDDVLSLIDGEPYSNDIDYTISAPYYTVGTEKVYSVPPKQYTVYNLFSSKSDDGKDLSRITNIVDGGNMLVGNGYNINLGEDKVSGLQIPSDGWYEIEIDLNDFGIPSWYNTDVAIKYANSYPSAEANTFEFQLLRYNAQMGSDSISHNTMFVGTYPNEAPSIISNDSSYDYPMYKYQQMSTSKIYTDLYYIADSVVAVDKANNENYLCGINYTNYLGIKCGYLKNGRSWNPSILKREQVLYNLDTSYKNYSPDNFSKFSGYYKVPLDNDGKEYETAVTTEKVPDLNKNRLPNNPTDEGFDFKIISDVDTTNKFLASPVNKRINAKLVMTVRLSRNEVIVPYAQIKRNYVKGKDDIELPIPLQLNMHMKIRSVAKNTTDASKISYDMLPMEDTIFLNLGNFLNNEQKITDFISSIQKSFNIDFQLIGNTVKMNFNKKKFDLISAPIDFDNRVNNSDIIQQPISFAKDLSVEFKIDTDEEGFYRSVPNDKIELDDWTNYGEFGYDKIRISNNDEAKDLQLKTNFSYNWYNTFRFNEKFSSIHCTRLLLYKDFSIDIDLPIIGSNEWWIENYNYEENEQYDGRSKTQRFWFRGEQKFNIMKEKDIYFDPRHPDEDVYVPIIVPVNSRWRCAGGYSESQEYFEKQCEKYGFSYENAIPYSPYRWYQVATCSNKKIINGVEYTLSYNNKNNSILDYFFNARDINSANNAIELEAYINSKEYMDILNGRKVKFDDDIWQVMKVNNFDTSGQKKTKMTLLQL